MAYLAKDSLPLQTTPWSPPAPAVISGSGGGGGGSRISPAVLFVIVIFAVIFFVSGLLHLLVRFLIKKRPSTSSRSPRRGGGGELSGPDALQRQLQQLFHLHDAGLDQASIDALPVFLYREVVGPEEPFDCAVCLCEFSRDDRLRLLPACGHAFHLDCIDTWLLSSSTCPLCRGALFLPIDNPVFDFHHDPDPDDLPVRLGKFRSTANCETHDDSAANGSDVDRREEGESSSSNLDARRCYSMGSYQYVLGDANLRVALRREDRVARKGESFSVSKTWLWKNKKGKFPDSSDSSPPDGGLPSWMNARRSVGEV